ncbi:MAG: acylphosphatase [Herpetosiphonaceae bacterium]|nr:MAG: acylphosphatase [Herpetosiphonaceae bacterium]
MESVRAHVIIEGRVQGVNFRAACRDQARQVGVNGWVKNRPDKTVEAIFEGPRAAVQRMVSWCYSGPPHARVDRVNVSWEEPTGKELPFNIAW